MLTWALGIHCTPKLRNSVLYTVCNQPNVATLSQKSISRFFWGLADFPRFFSEFSENVVLMSDDAAHFAHTVFDYMPKLAAATEYVSNVTGVYDLFRNCIIQDLSVSTDLLDRGMVELLAGVVKYCFRGTASAVPVDIRDIVSRLVAPNHAFTVVVDEETQRRVLKIH